MLQAPIYIKQHISICFYARQENVITKTKYASFSKIIVYIVCLLEVRGKKMMPDLEWRNRGQRFFPMRRKTYIFLCYITSVPFLRFFANQSEGHARRRRRRQTCSRWAGLFILKNYSFTIARLMPSRGCPHDFCRYVKHENPDLASNHRDDRAKNE